MRLFLNWLFRVFSQPLLENAENEIHVNTIRGYMCSDSVMYDSILKQRVVITSMEIYGEYHYRVKLIPLTMVGFVTKHYGEYSLQSREIPNRLKFIARI